MINISIRIGFHKNSSYVIWKRISLPFTLDAENNYDLKINKNKKHLNNSGNHYVYHTNQQSSNTIYYEAPFIKVIIEEKMPSPEKKDNNSAFYYNAFCFNWFLSLLNCFIWLICFKKIYQSNLYLRW